MINVLITCGGGFQGMTIYKSLKNNTDLSLHLFDINAENISKYFFDYFTQSKTIYDKDAYVNQLSEYVKENNIAYVFPSTAFDLEILSDLKYQFKDLHNCIVAVPTLKFVKEFNDKKRTHTFFNSNGLPTQNLLLKEEIESFPILAKSNRGWGGKGIYRINNTEELIKYKSRDFHFVEFLEGFNEFSIDFSVNQDGKCSHFIIRKRTLVFSGFSVITESQEIYQNKFAVYIKILKKLFSDIDKIGLYNIQFLQTECNKIFFTDLNSRIGTSAVLSKGKDQSILNHFFSLESHNIVNAKAIRYFEEKIYPIINVTKIKAVVFDLDDTLISNKEFILSRAIIFFSSLNLEQLFDLEKFKLFVLSLLNEGMAPYLIDKIKSRYNLEHSIEELLQLYSKCFPENISLYNDVIPSIDFLKQKGYRLFLLSDGKNATQAQKIKTIPNFLNNFEKTFFTSDYGLEKPDAKCFSLISEFTSFKMNEMVMVGDNEYRDIHGSLEAGFAYAFHILRKDGIVSHSIHDILQEKKNSYQIDSLHSLKFIL